MDDLVDPAHLVWPGGGEPRFPMQLWHVGYGHVATRHNPAEPGMSLWTPGGEHPVDRPAGAGDPPEPAPSSRPRSRPSSRPCRPRWRRCSRSSSPPRPSVVVANHAMGIYELAAIHLTPTQPKLAEASAGDRRPRRPRRGAEGRLGDDEATLREALAQLRAAYLEVRRTAERD